jgi:hypothetical protein
VAFAREAQRYQSNYVLVLLALIPVGAVSLVLSDSPHGDLSVAAYVFAGIALWMAVVFALSVRLRAAAPRAELLNLQLLSEIGEPYSLVSDAAPAELPFRARAGAAVGMLPLYDIAYGTLTLASHGDAISVGAVLERGALWSVMMVIANLTLVPAIRRDWQRHTTAETT